MHAFADTSGEQRASARRPGLRIRPPRSGHTDTVVLVLHGGRATSKQPARSYHLPYLRMLPIARSLHRVSENCAVWTLRNRVRGWNEPDMDAVNDAQWALREIISQHPHAQIVMVGHSLGGRVALRLADETNVVAVCALAPWIEPHEPVEHVSGKSLLILHGDDDRVTSAVASADFAKQAGTGRHLVIAGSGHSMLRRRREWAALTRRFLLAVTQPGGDE